MASNSQDLKKRVAPLDEWEDEGVPGMTMRVSGGAAGTRRLAHDTLTTLPGGAITYTSLFVVVSIKKSVISHSCLKMFGSSKKYITTVVMK